jgi:hypothetical protein
MRVTMDLAVAEDDTVSGSAVIAIENDVLELTGSTFDDVVGSEVLGPPDVEGVTIEPYDEDGFVGQELTFDGVALAEFNQDSGEDSIQIVRDGDAFRVSGSVDLSLDDVPSEGIPFDPQEMLERAEIRITLSFPGDVESSNGEVDGNTVTWMPRVGERTDFVAVASAVDGGSSSFVWVLLVAIVIGVIAAVALVATRRKPKPATPFDTPAPGAVPAPSATTSVATPGGAPAPTEPTGLTPQPEPTEVVPPQPAPTDVVPPQPAPEPEPPPEPPAAPGERPLA